MKSYPCDEKKTANYKITPMEWAWLYVSKLTSEGTENLNL